MITTDWLSYIVRNDLDRCCYSEIVSRVRKKTGLFAKLFNSEEISLVKIRSSNSRNFCGCDRVKIHIEDLINE